MAFVLSGAFCIAAQADSVIVIVRHGEKPAQGLGQLTCKGLNRSLALAPILLRRYGNPVAIYAPNPAVMKEDGGVPYAYIRPLATIEPLAIRAGLPVNIEWGMSDIDLLATRIVSVASGTQIISWEHHWGESLAKRILTRLGGNPGDVPKWDNADFDSIFVIRVNNRENGFRRATFSHEQEGLNGVPQSCTD